MSFALIRTTIHDSGTGALEPRYYLLLEPILAYYQLCFGEQIPFQSVEDL